MDPSFSIMWKASEEILGFPGFETACQPPEGGQLQLLDMSHSEEQLRPSDERCHGYAEKDCFLTRILTLLPSPNYKASSACI